MTERICETWAGNLAILSITFYRIVSLSQNVCKEQLTIVFLVPFQEIMGLFHYVWTPFTPSLNIIILILNR